MSGETFLHWERGADGCPVTKNKSNIKLREIGSKQSGEFVTQDVTPVAEKRKNHVLDVFGFIKGPGWRMKSAAKEFQKDTVE